MGKSGTEKDFLNGKTKTEIIGNVKVQKLFFFKEEK